MKNSTSHSLTTKLSALALALCAPFFLVSCEPDSPLENAAEEVDEAAEDVGDAVDDAVE